MAIKAKTYDPEAKSSRISFTTVELTPQQKKAWDMTRAALLWNCPAFTHILYTMMNPNDNDDVAVFTKDVPIAATDGMALILNPDTFFNYTLSERVFACAHEIMHAILDHCGLMHAYKRRGQIKYPNGKSLPYDDQMMNVATDLVINDLLIESNVGKFNKDWMHDKDYGVGTDSVIDVYAKVFKQNSGGGKGPSGSSFDQHLQPGKSQGQDPGQASQQRNQVEWQTAVAAANAAAKAQGKLPAGLERFFSAVLEPEVSWSEKVQAFFARKVGSGSYDWRRADRRLIVRDIYAPGRSGFGAGCVVVGVDTSGSVGQTELDRFFAEMRGIIEDVKPRILYVVWCDAKVHKVDPVEEAADLGGLKPHGGGGTDFRPVFDWIAENDLTPDALVYLTDGYGSFPDKEPTYPVLWGAIADGVKYPWGEVVSIPLK